MWDYQLKTKMHVLVSLTRGLLSHSVYFETKKSSPVRLIWVCTLIKLGIIINHVCLFNPVWMIISKFRYILLKKTQLLREFTYRGRHFEAVPAHPKWSKTEFAQMRHALWVCSNRTVMLCWYPPSVPLILYIIWKISC